MASAFRRVQAEQSTAIRFVRVGKEVDDSRPSGSGTGFFITEDGFLVTNEHVVRDAAQIRLVTAAGMISAKMVNGDAANDLALLETEGSFSPLPVVASRAVKLGGTVATVGFPNPALRDKDSRSSLPREMASLLLLRICALNYLTGRAKGEIASLSGLRRAVMVFEAVRFL